MTSRTSIWLVTLPLVLGCPTQAGQEIRATVPPTVVDATPRTADPDPVVMRAKLKAFVRAPVVVLGHRPVPTRGPPFRDIVVFEMNGADYCARSSTRPDDCVNDHGISWEMQEVLGLALITFDDPASPSVSRVRFVGGGNGDVDFAPEVEPFGEAPSANLTISALPTDVVLDNLLVDDVDGDGQSEFVVLFSYSVLLVYFDTVEVETFRKRLLVVRDDLSFEASAVLFQQWNTGASNITPDKNVMHGTYAFDPEDRTLVMEWCEVDPALWEQCSMPEMLCDRPTLRIRASYDRRADGYPVAQRTQLRPEVREWDERCE